MKPLGEIMQASPSLVYSFEKNNLNVYQDEKTKELAFYLVDPLTRLPKARVQEIVSFVPLEKISLSSRVKDFFPLTCVKIITLKDGSYKVYLKQMRPLAGGMDNGLGSYAAMTSEQLEATVREHLPKETFPGVKIESVYYKFMGLEEQLAKKIIISPVSGKLQEFVRAMRRFLIGFNFPHRDCRTYALTCYVLGRELTSEQRNHAEATLRALFAEGRKIFIIFNATSCTVELEESGHGCVIL